MYIDRALITVSNNVGIRCNASNMDTKILLEVVQYFQNNLAQNITEKQHHIFLSSKRSKFLKEEFCVGRCRGKQKQFLNVEIFIFNMSSETKTFFFENVSILFESKSPESPLLYFSGSKTSEILFSRNP